MNQHPILFSTPMVQSILSGKKTQTRRIIKPQPSINDLTTTFLSCKYNFYDILWVRETWQHTKILNLHPVNENYGYVYKADEQPWNDYEGWTWKPSIFMPKEACRIWLQITDIRIERLQEISESNAAFEGVKHDDEFGFSCYQCEKGHIGADNLCEDGFFKTAKESFESLWKNINGINSWNTNPYVWVIEFERVEKPELTVNI